MKQRHYLQWLLLLLFLVAAQGVSARKRYALTVTLADWTDVRFEITKSQLPKLSLKGKNYIVEDGKGATYTYPMAEVRRIRTTVDEVDDAQQVVVKIKELEQPKAKNCDVNDLKPGEEVTVYSLDGKQVDKLRANDNGRADIDLAKYPRGVYIIKSRTSTFKMTRQ